MLQADRLQYGCCRAEHTLRPWQWSFEPSAPPGEVSGVCCCAYGSHQTVCTVHHTQQVCPHVSSFFFFLGKRPTVNKTLVLATGFTSLPVVYYNHITCTYFIVKAVHLCRPTTKLLSVRKWVSVCVDCIYVECRFRILTIQRLYILSGSTLACRPYKYNSTPVNSVIYFRIVWTPCSRPDTLQGWSTHTHTNTGPTPDSAPYQSASIASLASDSSMGLSDRRAKLRHAPGVFNIVDYI